MIVVGSSVEIVIRTNSIPDIIYCRHYLALFRLFSLEFKCCYNDKNDQSRVWHTVWKIQQRQIDYNSSEHLEISCSVSLVICRRSFMFWTSDLEKPVSSVRCFWQQCCTMGCHSVVVDYNTVSEWSWLVWCCDNSLLHWFLSRHIDESLLAFLYRRQVEERAGPLEMDWRLGQGVCVCVD